MLIMAGLPEGEKVHGYAISIQYMNMTPHHNISCAMHGKNVKIMKTSVKIARAGSVFKPKPKPRFTPDRTYFRRTCSSLFSYDLLTVNYSSLVDMEVR